MWWTIFVILLVFWLLGLVSGYILSGFIHVLLVVAVVIVLSPASRAPKPECSRSLTSVSERPRSKASANPTYVQLSARGRSEAGAFGERKPYWEQPRNPDDT